MSGNINAYNCMSRKNKTSGAHIQCSYKKKIGDYCGIHGKQNFVYRIDQPIDVFTLTQPTQVWSPTILPPTSVSSQPVADLSNQTQTIIVVPTSVATSTSVSTSASTSVTVVPTSVATSTTSATTVTVVPTVVKKEIKKIVITKRVVEAKKEAPLIYDISEFNKLDANQIDYDRLLQTMRYYSINIKGNKQELFNLLAEFFRSRWIDPKNLKPHNTGYLAEISGPGFSDRSKCDNLTDFYELTPLSEIPDIYFFSFADTDASASNRIYGCDIRSFHQLVQTTKNSLNNRDMNVVGQSNWSITNPYNRQEISDVVLNLYEDKKWLLTQNRISIDYDEQKMDEATTFKFQVLDVFQIMYGFGYPVNHEWFMDLTTHQLHDFYIKLEDIWNYRLQLSPSQQKKIIPNNDIFLKAEQQSVKKYVGNHPENKKKLRNILLTIMRKMVTEGVTKADCINGTIYVLTGLAEVSQTVASALPGVVIL